MDNFLSHILVVDDDDGIRTLVKKYLNENNYLVTTANSAENAAEKIKVVVFVLLSLSVCANGHSDVLLENPHNRNSQVIILMYSLFTGVLSIKLIFLYVYLAGEPAGAFNLLSRPGPRTVPELT